MCQACVEHSGSARYHLLNKLEAKSDSMEMGLLAQLVHADQDYNQNL